MANCQLQIANSNTQKLQSLLLSMMPIVQSALTNTAPSRDQLNALHNQMHQMTSDINGHGSINAQQNLLCVPGNDTTQCPEVPVLQHQWSTVFDNWQSSSTLDGKLRIWFKKRG